MLQCSLEGHVISIVFSKTLRCHRFRQVSFTDVNLIFHQVYLPAALSCRWCRPSYSIPFRWRRTLQRMCASLLLFCASSGRAGPGVRIPCLTRVRTGPPFGWVSRMFHISKNQPTSSCLRNWFSHSTSISASPVTPGFSVTCSLSNAANTDMKGCPIWCPFSPLAASLYAFPCALAAANGWNEATSPE